MTCMIHAKLPPGICVLSRSVTSRECAVRVSLTAIVQELILNIINMALTRMYGLLSMVWSSSLSKQALFQAVHTAIWSYTLDIHACVYINQCCLRRISAHHVHVITKIFIDKLCVLSPTLWTLSGLFIQYMITAWHKIIYSTLCRHKMA